MTSNETLNADISLVKICQTPEDVDGLIERLQKKRFDLENVSLVGAGRRGERQVIGCYFRQNQMKLWGASNVFWNRQWKRLFGSGFFSIPGLDAVLAAGAIVEVIVSVLEERAAPNGLNPLEAAFYRLGIAKNTGKMYETAIKQGKLVALVHGTAEELERVKDAVDSLG